MKSLGETLQLFVLGLLLVAVCVVVMLWRGLTNPLPLLGVRQRT